jgi:hypothetical protein
MKTPLLRAATVLALFVTSTSAQDWTDEQLVQACAGFQTPTLPPRLAQVGTLLAEAPRAMNALVARIHGDHREYRLKVDRLLDELGDARWQVRENAERTLIEIGNRAKDAIRQRSQDYQVLEQHIRCRRVIDALEAKGDEQEKKELALLRGLVATSLYLPADQRLSRSLRSALGHTDSSIGDGAIRALGKVGTDDDCDAVLQMVTFKNGVHRTASLSALGRMNAPKALATCRTLLLGPLPGDGPLAGIVLTRTEAMAMLRALLARTDDAATSLLNELGKHPDPVLAAAATKRVPPGTARTAAKFTMPDRTQLAGEFGGLLGDSLLAHGMLPELPLAELSFADCDTIDFPAHAAVEAEGVRVFLNQGSLIRGVVLGIDPESVRLRSARFGDLVLPRKDVQGIAFDPKLDRLVGGSSEHDRVRDHEAKFRDGQLLRADATTLVLQDKEGKQQSVPLGEVAGLLFTRPRTTEPDTTIYNRLDLTNGERLIGFVGSNHGEGTAISVPQLGAAVVPWRDVQHVELGVGGGALWGFTLIADYSDNRVVEVDEQGRPVFVMEEVFGAWDAECLDNGNLLLTEFAVSRVQEVDRKGKQLWVFDDLKNPYDADRLPNGNTLIADTFGSRVIEVDQAGKIVWSFAKDIRPFDVDRLPNGNTLIADVLKDRVLEISPGGEVVWELKGLPNAHDADRLPNGNTLVTLRNKGSVLELDRDGKVVWELQGLSSPSDADRLPNGNTIVAENTRVREFDRRGNEVWKKDMTWAVEVNRY